MATGGSKEPTLTRSTAAQSKELWDKYKSLLDKYHTDLEEWQMDRPTKNMENLTRVLQGDLSDRDTIWAAMEALQMVNTDVISYKHKLSNIDKLINNMENEVENAPSGIHPTDKDTCSIRQVAVLDERKKQELANDAFTAYESRYKRLKLKYGDWANDDGTPIIKTEANTARARAEAQARRIDGS